MGDNRPKLSEAPLPKLNAIRVIIVMMIALGYASTMPLGENNSAGLPNPEFLAHLGYDPSWIGISLLFFLSGFLGMRSLDRHESSTKYLESRLLRNIPVLIFVTLIVVLLLYPVFGQGTGSTRETLSTIFFYFLGTVTCIKPGELLPGLLDSAAYMCIAQGAIWTLKWGVIAHIIVALGYQIKLFSNRAIVLCLSLLSIVFYISIVFVHLNYNPMPADIVLAAQLGWPFLVGISVYQYWDKLPRRVWPNLLITAGFFGLAFGLYYTSLMPWSKAIIVSLTMGWGWLCVTLLKLETHQFSFLNNWAPLALALYLVNWPTAQILLLVLPELPLGVFMTFSLTITTLIAWSVHKLIAERAFDYASRRRVMAA